VSDAFEVTVAGAGMTCPCAAVTALQLGARTLDDLAAPSMAITDRWVPAFQ
jgi:hypothetical protein